MTTKEEVEAKDLEEAIRARYNAQAVINKIAAKRLAVEDIAEWWRWKWARGERTK